MPLFGEAFFLLGLSLLLSFGRAFLSMVELTLDNFWYTLVT